MSIENDPPRIIDVSGMVPAAIEMAKEWDEENILDYDEGLVNKRVLNQVAFLKAEIERSNSVVIEEMIKQFTKSNNASFTQHVLERSLLCIVFIAIVIGWATIMMLLVYHITQE